MNDNILFTFGILLAVIITIVGFSSVGLSLGDFTLSGGGGRGMFASALAAVETNWSSTVGQFLVSFDSFKNIHQIILEENTQIKVFDVDYNDRLNEVYVSTDKGLFLSRDGGLTYNRFISSNFEINKASNVFKVLPAASNGEDYFISVFSNGRGVVYRTYDYFFNIEPLMIFDNEAAYDMYRSGNSLYLAVSNGQIIHFNLKTKESKVVNVFSSPVLKIQKSAGGEFFLMMKSGQVLRGNSLDGKFEKAKTPGGAWLFGSSPVGAMHFTSNGTIYVLNSEGIYASYDNGVKYELLKHIPIQEKKIDAMGINKGKIYAVSGTRLFTSSDGGDNWKIDFLDNAFRVSRFFFAGDRVILSM